VQFLGPDHATRGLQATFAEWVASGLEHLHIFGDRAWRGTHVLPLRSYRHIDRWSPKKSLSENLELILGRDYALTPRLDNEHPEVKRRRVGLQRGHLVTLSIALLFSFLLLRQDPNDDRECGICYTFKLNDELPDKVCEEPRCGRGFHPSCLAEWLHALPETRHSFGTLFGECPYCGTAISGLIKGSVAGADEQEEGVAM
jgi:hypothetical protein